MHLLWKNSVFSVLLRGIAPVFCAPDARTGLPKRQIGQDAMAVLQSHVWPGNVRQLRNNVERVMILAAGGPEAIVTADMLPQDVGSMVPAMPTSNNGEHIMGLPLREAREVFERDYLIAQISRFSGNISRTAEFVGMERSALHRKLKSLGLVDMKDGEE